METSSASGAISLDPWVSDHLTYQYRTLFRKGKQNSRKTGMVTCAIIDSRPCFSLSVNFTESINPSNA